jgi:hypothetical protein
MKMYNKLQLKQALSLIDTKEFRKEARKCFEESLHYSSSNYTQILFLNEKNQLEHATVYGTFTTGLNILPLISIKSINLNDREGWDLITIEAEGLTEEEAYSLYTGEYFQDWYLNEVEFLEQHLNNCLYTD